MFNLSQLPNMIVWAGNPKETRCHAPGCWGHRFAYGLDYCYDHHHLAPRCLEEGCTMINLVRPYPWCSAHVDRHVQRAGA